MHSPNSARRWVEAGDYLEARVRKDQQVLAPDLFWWRLPSSIDRWVTRNLQRDHDYDWVVVPQTDIEQFPRRFLEHVTSTTRPVFANELFVVWSPDPALETIDPASKSLLSFIVRVAKLPEEPAKA